MESRTKKLKLTLESQNLKSAVTISLNQSNKLLFSSKLVPGIEFTATVDVLLFGQRPILSIQAKSIKLPLLDLLMNRFLVFSLGEYELKISCTTQEIDSAIIDMKGIELDDLDVFDLSDPYFILYSNGTEIYRSEVIMDNLNPVWKRCKLPKIMLNDPFKIEVWDKDLNKDDFIGDCSVDPAELTTNELRKVIHNPKKKGETKSGELVIKTVFTKDFTVEIFNGRKLGCVHIIDCYHEYGKTSLVQSLIENFVSTSENFYVGFGSSMSKAWTIDRSNKSSIFSDPALAAKIPGPCVLAYGLIYALRNIELSQYWVFFVYLQRDIFDTSTVQGIIEEINCYDIHIKVIVSDTVQCQNLDSINGIQKIKYRADNFIDDIEVGIGNLSDDFNRNF